MQTIAVDFDGVIHKYSKGYHDTTCYDVPNEEAEYQLKRLLKKYCVYIHSVRGCEEIQEWMNKNIDIPTEIITEDSIYWTKKGIIGITNRKLAAVAYIDDKAIRFTNWRDVGNYFL